MEKGIIMGEGKNYQYGNYKIITREHVFLKLKARLWEVQATFAFNQPSWLVNGPLFTGLRNTLILIDKEVILIKVALYCFLQSGSA